MKNKKMTESIKNVVVVGAGGMGALFGSILAEGGLDVTLVDNDREHVDAIRKSGLHISGLGGERHQQIRADMMLAQLQLQILFYSSVRERQPLTQQRH